ncbi:MAG TPA: hypothetical protein VFA81_05165, partial [Burkholderiales bacterium]|nr:hypothetical protein [Burkholderiales bacterium]
SRTLPARYQDQSVDSRLTQVDLAVPVRQPDGSRYQVDTSNAVHGRGMWTPVNRRSLRVRLPEKIQRCEGEQLA